MLYSDLHTHTRFSFDSQADVFDMCEKACAMGLHTIAFTEHWDCLDPKYTLPFEDSKKYYNDHSAIAGQVVMDARERYNGRIRVLYAIELGQPNVTAEDSRTFLAAHDFDFVLGSIHNAPTGEDYYYVDYASGNTDDILDNYYRAHFDLLKFGDFDSIGHLDYPIRVMKDYIASADQTKFRDVIAEIVRTAADQGIALEINTNGLRNWFDRLSPQPWVLDLYRSFGGEIVTIGSDAHKPEHVGFGIKEAYDLAASCGLKVAVSYDKRKPIISHF